MGGARALEWAVTYPERVRRCGVISIGASSTAEQIAFAQAQTLAIRQDPHFNGGDYYAGPVPEAGLALARRIAHITYRSAQELDFRFGRNAQASEAPLQADPWLAAAGTRWKATWTTRAASSWGASMPTATSQSPKRS